MTTTGGAGQRPEGEAPIVSAETLRENVGSEPGVTSAPAGARVLAGRFDLGPPLGSGGMATVYRAWDRLRGCACAVKMPGEPLSQDEEFRRRFRREAASAMGLVHPRIVSVYGCGEAGPRQYLAMEYVVGGTLRDLLRRRGALPEPDALRIASEVADALSYAHSRGVVHRDIKPHNVLLTEDGSVKVADFGIARTLDATNLTRTGAFMGSAHYMAPEQARGEHGGPPSDLYALGVVLFEMLAGRVPFEGEAPVAVALKHLHEPPPDLGAIRPDLSPATLTLVRRLLAKAPRERCPAAADAAAELRRVASGLPAAGGETAVLPRVAAAPPAHATAFPDGLPARHPTERLAGGAPPAGAGSGGATAALSARGIADTGRLPTPPARTGRGRVWVRAAVVAAIGVCVVGLAAVGYRGAWLAAHAAVPSLTGRTVAAAGRAVLPLQLGVVVTAQREDARQPVGVILAQDPPAGREVLKGSVIELTVSQGSGLVPDLRGVSVARAVQLLEAAGLRLGRVSYSRDDQTPSGDVIVQFERAGTRLAPNGGVDVLVSQGPPALPATPWFLPVPGERTNDNK